MTPPATPSPRSHRRISPLVGTAANTVVGTQPPGAATGTYLGSTPLEDMWGLFMLEEMDNLAEYLVSTLNTTDGATLSGFPSREAALLYDYTSPLQWFPAAVAVTEPSPVRAGRRRDRRRGEPLPDAHERHDHRPTSRSVDLAALLLGNALLFGETDARNAGVGQQIGLQCTFDGDPFPADDGIADGEATLHDRTLGILRVAFIDLDRMHTVPLGAGGGITVDTATVAGGAVTPGTTVTMTNLAHVDDRAAPDDPLPQRQDQPVRRRRSRPEHRSPRDPEPDPHPSPPRRRTRRQASFRSSARACAPSSWRTRRSSATSSRTATARCSTARRS